MSRRKQSNPKSIKVPADPAGVDSSGQDASLEDAKKEILSEQTEKSEGKMNPKTTSSCGSPYSSVDSPDHIDVVNNTHSPSTPPPLVLWSRTPASAPSQLDTALPESIVVKVERDVVEDSCPDNELVHAGSPQAQDGQSVTQGLVRHLQLPSDVLYLKKLEVSVHGNPTVSWVVCSAIPLPKGSSLGPFSGDIIASDSIKVGDLIVQFKCNRTGHMALVNVAGHTGAWLALLRPAHDLGSRNTHVYLEGGRIWCEIVADIDQGTELRATFEFDLDELPAADCVMAVAPASPSTSSASDRPLTAESPPAQQQTVTALQHTSPPGHAALIYGCPFCGVRFSSPRTLQGHLSYYCSKKKSDLIVSPRPKPSTSADSSKGGLTRPDMSKVKQEMDSMDSSDSASLSQDAQKMHHTSGNKRPATAAEGSNVSDREQSSPLPAKIPHLDAPVLRCPLCSYCADKPASLTRHMRIHNRPAETVTSPERSDVAGNGMIARPGASPLGSSATYCKECSIQFSSLSTFCCHKEFYCSQRRSGLPARRDDVKSESVQVMTGPMSISIAQELSAASLQLATLGQGGFVFPSAQQVVSSSGASMTPGGSIMPAGQAAVIVMTPSGLANMAIPLPSVLVQSIQSAAAAAAAAAMGAPVSPSHIPAHKASISPKPSTSNTSPRAGPDEAHQNISPKKTSAAEDSRELPLDLSIKKADTPRPVRISSSGEIPVDLDESIKVEIGDERSSSVLSQPPPLISPAATRPRSSASSEASAHSSSSPSSTSVTTASLAGIPHLISTPSLLPGFLPMHPMAAAAAGLPSIPLPGQGQGLGTMPSGISKCTDCNIIFYKHENYLVHKKVYCSGKKHRTERPATPDNLQSSEDFESGDIASATTSVVSRASRSPRCSPSPGHPSFLQVAAGDYIHPAAATVPHVKAGLRSPLGPCAASEEVYYKFFCIPCKIKFSSASNLKAHKEFYCPHGKNSEHTVIVQTQGGEIVGASTAEQHSPTSSSSSPSPGQYCCNQCHTIFSSSRLLKLHLCSAEMTQTTLLRCSHCEYVTQTDKRLAEHMKVHNPTSAYRCTLCGYRGNTVRGMRMHGKTHTDNGEDFTDSHMVEFQEPPLVPIQTNNDHKTVQGPLDIEAELIRLKNEPYKRRRSRKAFEKVDILAIPDHPLACQVCGECFTEPRSFSMHMQIHEITSQYNQALVHCDECEYIAKSLDDLRAHSDISHSVIPKEEKENHPRSVSPARTPSSERDSTERCTTPHGKLTPIPISVKSEPVDTDFSHYGESTANTNRSELREENSESEERRSAFECREGDEDTIVESRVNGASPSRSPERSATLSTREDKSEARHTAHTLLDTAHDSREVDNVQIKAEPGAEEHRESTSRDLPSKTPSPAPLAVKTPPSVSSKPPCMLSSPEHGASRKSPPSSPAPTTSSTVKVEPDFLPHSLPVSASGLFPYFLLPPPSTLVGPARDVVAPPGRGKGLHEDGGGEREVMGPPYCKNCDISFTYLSTFIAHKKYYCTGRNNVTPSATA